MDRRRRMIRIVLGLCTLGAVVCAAIFLLHREPPQKAAAEPPAEVAPPTEPPQTPEVIRSRGVVTPKIRVEVMPEVAGKVVYVHSQLHAGGLIHANEKIAEIDPSGYELAVRKAQAAVDEAQAKLDVERGATALRQPQGQQLDAENQVALPTILQAPLVRQAEAALESAKTELAIAELSLSRTSVVLPYDVLIAGETTSLGQYAAAGRSLAVAYGTEAFEIEVPVRSEDLDRLGVLDRPEDSGSPQVVAEVRAAFAGREYVWSGGVLRTTSRVDPESGMMSIVVDVSSPMEASADRPKLLPGTPVEVLLRRGGAADPSDDAENVGER